MSTNQHRNFVYGHLAWMLATVLMLTLIGALTPRTFFVIALLGLLIVTELTASRYVTARWRVRLRWVVLSGLVVIGYLVVRRILGILPEGII